MKKIFSMVAIAATALMLGSCGFGGVNPVTNVAAGVLGNALTGNNSGATTGSTLASTGLNLLSTLLGGNTVNKNTIVGTWTYAKPEITFESNNVLAGIGGQLAGNKLESTLGTQLEKIGLKAGVSKFNFKEDGTMTITVNGKTTNGTYTLNGNSLTMKGALGLTTINATVSIQGNQLFLLFEANAIFNAITKLGQSSSSISSLLGNFNGMKLGWSMTK